MATTMEIRIDKTKKGYPAIWECGGGMTSTGYSQIIANSDGSPKKPVWVNKRGHLACADHALFILQDGDIIVQTDHHRRDFEIWVLRFEGTDIDGLYAKTTVLAHYSRGEWDNEEIAEKYKAVIKVAKEKTTCYHCRSPHYIEY